MSLSLGSGVALLLGSNGAGKTTLLRTVAGLLTPSAGSLSVLGVTPKGRGDWMQLYRDIAYLPQEVGLLGHLTVAQYVAYARWLRGADARQSQDEAADVLGLLGLADLAWRRCRALSGGQQRRVQLAGVLAGRPRVLLLDEPTSNVDAESRSLIRMAVRQVAEQGSLVMAATHHPDELGAAAQVCLSLADGTFTDLEPV